MAEIVEVRNVNNPDCRERVNRARYNAVTATMLKSIADRDGMPQTEMEEAAKRHSPRDLFSDGRASGRWLKTVRLDHEARGEVGRMGTKHLKLCLK